MTQVTDYVSFNLIYCPWPQPLPTLFFADHAMVCKLANALNKELTSPGLLMRFAQDRT